MFLSAFDPPLNPRSFGGWPGSLAAASIASTRHSWESFSKPIRTEKRDFLYRQEGRSDSLSFLVLSQRRPGDRQRSVDSSNKE